MRHLAGLTRIWQGFPLEGLAVSGLAGPPQRLAGGDDSDQLYSLAGVIGTGSNRSSASAKS